METGLEEKATLKTELEEMREALGRRDTEVYSFSFTTGKFFFTKFPTGEGITSSTRHPGEEPQAAGDSGDEEEEGGEETAGGRRKANRDAGGSGDGEGHGGAPR